MYEYEYILGEMHGKMNFLLLFLIGWISQKLKISVLGLNPQNIFENGHHSDGVYDVECLAFQWLRFEFDPQGFCRIRYSKFD